MQDIILGFQRHIKLKDIYISHQQKEIDQLKNLIVHKYDFDKINKEHVRLLTDDEVKCLDVLRSLDL